MPASETERSIQFLMRRHLAVLVVLYRQCPKLLVRGFVWQVAPQKKPMLQETHCLVYRIALEANQTLSAAIFVAPTASHLKASHSLVGEKARCQAVRAETSNLRKGPSVPFAISTIDASRGVLRICAILTLILGVPCSAGVCAILTLFLGVR